MLQQNPFVIELYGTNKVNVWYGKIHGIQWVHADSEYKPEGMNWIKIDEKAIVKHVFVRYE